MTTALVALLVVLGLNSGRCSAHDEGGALTYFVLERGKGRA